MSTRYGPASTLVSVVLALSESRTGLTIEDIRGRFDVSRRTAERLLHAAREFGEVEELPAWEDRRKRWRMTAVPPVLAQVAADELAALDLAVSRLSDEGLSIHAERLRQLLSKVRLSIEGKAAARVETDLEAILEAEGFASRPGPRPEIDPVVLGTLRHAAVARRKVRIHYRYRSGERETEVVVHPYGFLYGALHYLVAWSEAESARDVRIFALPNVLSADLLDGESFTMADGFSLSEWSRSMFGVFRETPRAVVWRFSREAAADARRFRFHPDQVAKDLPDGRLEVSFTAGGLREMAWHLFRWGSEVEIVSPPELRDLLVGMLQESLASHLRGAATVASAGIVARPRLTEDQLG